MSARSFHVPISGGLDRATSVRRAMCRSAGERAEWMSARGRRDGTSGWRVWAQTGRVVMALSSRRDTYRTRRPAPGRSRGAAPKLLNLGDFVGAHDDLILPELAF